MSACRVESLSDIEKTVWQDSRPDPINGCGKRDRGRGCHFHRCVVGRVLLELPGTMSPCHQ